MALVAPSAPHCVNLPKPLCCASLSTPNLDTRCSLPGRCSTKLVGFSTKLQVPKNKAGGWRGFGFGAVRASEVGNSASADAQRWLLEPVGDGDSRHIGFKVPMPDSFEIASNTVTVGRLPEKADMVIPVATVSGLHARIQTKEGSLLVTDLDSTNGTFINEKRLRPGEAAAAYPGSLITFGDTHLALFCVSKLEIVETTSKPEESDVELKTSSNPVNSEATV